MENVPFAEIERFVKEHPQDAQAMVTAWERVAQEHPDVIGLTSQQWYTWLEEHPDLNINPYVYVGNAIRMSYPDIRPDKPEASSTESPATGHGESHNPLNMLGLPLFLFMEKNHVMEKDKKYQEIAEKQKEEWRKKNQAKDFNTKDGLDFLFGSLDDPKKPSLQSLTEEEFRKTYRNKADFYDYQKKLTLDHAEQDQALQHTEEQIKEETGLRLALAKTENPNTKEADVAKAVSEKRWEQFAEKHPEKAAKYGKTHKEVKSAIDRIEKRKQEEKERQSRTPRIPQISTAPFFGNPRSVPIQESTKAPILPPPITIPNSRPSAEPQSTQSYPSFSQARSGFQASRSILEGLGRKKAAQEMEGQVANSFIKKRLLAFFASSWIIWIIAALIVTVLLILLFSGGTGPNPSGVAISPPPGGSTSPVSLSCSFSRAGSSAPYKSQTLINLFTQAGAKYGIPAPILAALARHESPEFTTNADDNHSAIQSGEYCNPGQPFCEKGGVRLHGGACTAGDPTGSQTGRAQGLMQIVDVFNPDIDACNLQQNIDRAAKTLRDKVSGDLTSEENVKKAVCRYFGIDGDSCVYSQNYDYGADVWNDYQACLASNPPQTTTTPPSGGNPSGNFVYFCEADPRFNDDCHQRLAICGPTSVAMVADTLTGSALSPKDIDSTFISNGWRSCGSDGSSMGPALSSSWFNGLGLRAISILYNDPSSPPKPLDLTEAQKYLKSGAYIIGSVSPHIFVIDQVDVANNKVHLRDPDPGNTNQCQDPNGYWRDNNTPWISSVSGGYPWYYAYAVQKVK